MKGKRVELGIRGVFETTRKEKVCCDELPLEYEELIRTKEKTGDASSFPLKTEENAQDEGMKAVFLRSFAFSFCFYEPNSIK